MLVKLVGFGFAAYLGLPCSKTHPFHSYVIAGSDTYYLHFQPWIPLHPFWYSTCLHILLSRLTHCNAKSQKEHASLPHFLLPSFFRLARLQVVTGWKELFTLFLLFSFCFFFLQSPLATTWSWWKGWGGEKCSNDHLKILVYCYASWSLTMIRVTWSTWFLKWCHSQDPWAMSLLAVSRNSQEGGLFHWGRWLIWAFWWLAFLFTILVWYFFLCKIKSKPVLVGKSFPYYLSILKCYYVLWYHSGKIFSQGWP